MCSVSELAGEPRYFSATEREAWFHHLQAVPFVIFQLSRRGSIYRTFC